MRIFESDFGQYKLCCGRKWPSASRIRFGAPVSSTFQPQRPPASKPQINRVALQSVDNHNVLFQVHVTFSEQKKNYISISICAEDTQIAVRGSLTFYSLPVTWCTTSLTFNNCTFCPHCIYVFCIYLRTNSDFEMKSVYSAVRTGSLNKAYWSRDAPPV